MSPVSEERFLSLETKIDKLAEAVMKLVLIDERQITQGTRIGKVEEEIGKLHAKLEAELGHLRASNLALEREVNKWKNFAVGAWAVVVVAWALYTKLLA